MALYTVLDLKSAVRGPCPPSQSRAKSGDGGAESSVTKKDESNFDDDDTTTSPLSGEDH